MQPNSEARAKQVRNLAFAIHTFVYGAIFAVALLSSTSNGYNGFETLALVWTIPYLLHVRGFYTSGQRVNTTDLERQAYRDGFNDAMRQMARQAAEAERSHDRYESRMTLDDDGELLEADEIDYAYSKRKRR
ncbi:MAG: hypothetical protein SF162_01550 [bacterium]|nr:hypothetical protein [bacterium]